MSAKLSVTIASLSLLVGGCGTEQNLCAEAARHLEQCAGLTVSVPETCAVDRASYLLGIPCDELSGSRGTFSSGMGLAQDVSDGLFGDAMSDFLDGSEESSWNDESTSAWGDSSVDELASHWFCLLMPADFAKSGAKMIPLGDEYLASYQQWRNLMNDLIANGQDPHRCGGMVYEP